MKHLPKVTLQVAELGFQPNLFASKAEPCNQLLCCFLGLPPALSRFGTALTLKFLHMLKQIRVWPWFSHS